MKRILLFSMILIFLVSGCFLFYSNSGEKNISGEIEVVGNEPFTRLALKTNTSEIYILNCSKSYEELLLRNQGKIAKIYFKDIDDAKRPNVITVIKVEIISDK